MGNRIITQVGDVYGRLTVLEQAKSKNGRAMWICKCSCGSEPRAYMGKLLRNGATKSCGCLLENMVAEKVAANIESMKTAVVGKTIGALLVLEYVQTAQPRSGHNSHFFLCECECGTQLEVDAYRLLNNKVHSCGCVNRAKTIETCSTHAMTGTPTHRTWQKLRNRCNNPNYEFYHRYGGRGITYDPSWEKFENFFADMGLRPEGTTLDRIDNDGNYCKENCRWSTQSEQMNNTSVNRMLTAFGKSQSLTEWAKDQGLTCACLRARIYIYKWSIEKALTTPSARKSEAI